MTRDQAPLSPPRLEPVVLAGRHVRLEPLRVEHEPELLEAALSDPRIWDYMAVRVASAADLRGWVQAALASRADGLALPFAVVELASGRAIGSTRLFDYHPRDRGIEIGHTWYARAAWGGAVNPEAKLLLLRHAFERLGCVRVQLKTDARNQRSRAAIARLGAREEGTLRKHMLVQGGVFRDSVYFSILDDEWPAVQAGLEARLRALAPAV